METYEIDVALTYEVRKTYRIEARSEQEANIRALGLAAQVTLDQVDTDWNPPVPATIQIEEGDCKEA